MAAQDEVPGGGLDRAVLADLLGRFQAVVGGATRQAPRGGGPDPISQWTATEHGEGPPLYAIVDLLGPLLPDAIAALTLGISAELARMHAAGAIHRRLMPSNVLLPETGPRLVHTGVPHTVDGATITDLDGSPLVIGYLTPEQVLGQPVGPETDIFALGGVLAYAATGMPPFGSDEPLSVLFRIVNEEPALDAVPDAVRGLIKACLSKLPAQRPTLQTLTARAIGVLKDAHGVQDLAKDPSGAEVPEQRRQRRKQRAPDARPAPVRAAPAGSTDVRAQDVTATDVHLSDFFAARQPTDTRLMPMPLTSMAIPGTHKRRKRSTNVALVGTVAIGVAAAFLVRGVAESSTPSSAQSGVLPAAPIPTASSTAAAALPGTFLAGLDCPASPWASTTESIAASAGLAPNVGGGLAACGGKAIAFLKSGTTAPGASSVTWTFRLGTPARCTLSVYVAAADSSSGYAHYRLIIPAPSNATNAPATSAAAGNGVIFQINQSTANGKFVAAPELTGLNLPDGSVRLVLTDAGAYAGDKFHVTASAVQASCSPAA